MLLHSEYSDPRTLLDDIISAGELKQFTRDMIKQKNDRELWELYLSLSLAREMSFSEFREQVMPDTGQPIENKTTEELIAQSLLIAGVAEEVRDECI